MYDRAHDATAHERARPASSATRWARWPSRPTPSTAPRPSGPCSTSRSPASASRAGSSGPWRSSSWPRPRPTPSWACSPADVAAAIAEAAREVADGAHDDQFPIDIYQTGSGTSTNTNMNEVIAHLADGAPRRLAQGPPQRRRQPLPELERRDPDARSSCRPRWPSRRSCCPPSNGCTPRSWRRNRSSGRWSRRAGRISRTRPRSASARSSAATPARSRRRSAGPGPPRPSCCSMPLGGHGRRDGDQRPPRVRVPDLRPAVRADRTRRPRDLEPLPRPGDPRRGDRGARRGPLDRARASGRSPATSG